MSHIYGVLIEPTSNQMGWQEESVRWVCGNSKATTPSSELLGRTDRIQEETTEDANATPSAFKTITHSVYTCALAAFKTSKK
jgi:hypothetical protein